MKILLIMIVLVGLSFSLSYTGKNSKHVKKSQNYKSRRFINNHLRQTFQEIDYSTKNIIQKSSISWSNESLNLQSSIQSSLYPSSFNIFHFHRFVINLFRTTFLPAGYPESVPPEYLQFQIWNTIQDLCSYLRGIMSTRAVLEGLGVGKADVTAVQGTKYISFIVY